MHGVLISNFYINAKYLYKYLLKLFILFILPNFNQIKHTWAYVN